MNDDELLLALRDAARPDQFDRPTGDPLEALRTEFQIGEPLGAGGQATVYRARRRADGATVAIKVWRGLAAFRDEQRSRRAAELTCQLDHGAIVPILDHGSAAGHPYTIQPLINGEGLDTWSRGLPPEDARDRRLRVAELLARAVAHAHERGVLHRDLKPSNVLVDDADRPHLLDFGIARGTDVALPLTATSEFIGTLAYAPPERFRDKASRDGVRQDVYGLGAILYEMFAGNAPFRCDAPLAVILGRMDRGVGPLRSQDRALSTVIRRAMHPLSDRRYRSAVELANDLARLRSGRPVLAKPDPWTDRVLRFERRHRRLLVAAVGLAVGLGATLWAMNRDRVALEADRDVAAVSEALRLAAPGQGVGLSDTPARLAAAAAHLEATGALPILQADLLEQLGMLWLDLDIERAEPHLRETRRLLLEEGDADPERVLRIDLAIGTSLSQRRRDEAIPLLEGVLRRYEDRHGPSSGETAVVRSAMAEALLCAYYRPEPERARRELQKAIRDLAAAYGADHPEVAWASLLTMIGSDRTTNADPTALESIVEQLRRPPGSPRRFTYAVNLLATRLERRAERGDLDRAAALRREASSRMQISGAWHVADLLRVEAMARLGQDDAVEAEVLLRQAMVVQLDQEPDPDGADRTARDALLVELRNANGARGRHHPLVRGHRILLEQSGLLQWQRGADMQDGARVLMARRDLDGAHALLKMAITVSCQEFGMDCPVRLASLRLLAECEFEQGKRDAARAHLIEAWEAARRLGRISAPNYAQTGNKLIELLERLGDSATAKEFRLQMGGGR